MKNVSANRDRHVGAELNANSCCAACGAPQDYRFAVNGYGDRTPHPSPSPDSQPHRPHPFRSPQLRCHLSPKQLSASAIRERARISQRAKPQMPITLRTAHSHPTTQPTHTHTHDGDHKIPAIVCMCHSTGFVSSCRPQLHGGLAQRTPFRKYHLERARL